MKKIALFLAFSVGYILIYAQVPQGFNYQAIARNSSGEPIVNTTLQVKIAILSDTLIPVVVREEVHSSVKTNAFGMFSLVVGSKPWTEGPIINFEDIDWKATPLFIRTKIFYDSEWKNLGSAQLWSVPYSMIAGDLGGSVKKLEVMGEDETSDEALFEVKRKDGELMFGVYNHGVRVNMPLDTLSKTRKGGFIVAGFDNVKGIVQDYLVVNPDSIRAYIDTNPIKTRKGGFAVAGFTTGKEPGQEYLRVTRDSTRVYLNDTGAKTRKGGFAVGGFVQGKQSIQDYMLVSSDSVRIFINDTTTAKTRKGGFAIGGFKQAKEDEKNYFNVSGKAQSDIINGEPKVMWYPRKEAFMAGNVLVESQDSVGTNSWASGYRSKAIGDWSQALGYQAIARGNYSTAIGINAVADSINSFAFGDSARAKNDESYAIGRGAIASGYRSFAFGSSGIDTLGNPTVRTCATGPYSFAIGQGCNSIGFGSVSMGILNTASGDYSVAMGYKTAATGKASFTMGLGNVASGTYSVSIGNLNTSSGGRSITLGGWNSISSGFCSIAIGAYLFSRSGYETVIGLFNEDYTPVSSGGFDYNDRLFTIGCGTSPTHRHNAMTVLKNGNVGIGRNPTTNKLEVEGTASKTTAGSWLANSDSRIKTQIMEIENAQSTITKLHPIIFKYTDEWKTRNPSIQDKLYYNFIAQEFREVFPESVQGSGEFLEGQPDEILQLDSYNAQIVAIKALQELIIQNKEQKQQIESYKSENDNLKSQLQSLQQEVKQIKAFLATIGGK